MVDRDPQELAEQLLHNAFRHTVPNTVEETRPVILQLLTIGAYSLTANEARISRLSAN